MHRELQMSSVAASYMLGAEFTVEMATRRECVWQRIHGVPRLPGAFLRGFPLWLLWNSAVCRVSWLLFISVSLLSATSSNRITALCPDSPDITEQRWAFFEEPVIRTCVLLLCSVPKAPRASTSRLVCSHPGILSRASLAMSSLTITGNHGQHIPLQSSEPRVW